MELEPEETKTIKVLTDFWERQAKTKSFFDLSETKVYFFKIQSILSGNFVKKTIALYVVVSNFLQKQSSGGVLRKKCSLKFHNISKKTPVLESLFNRVAGLKACSFIKKLLKCRCFPVNIAKFLRTPILKNIWKRRTLFRGCIRPLKR